MKKKKFLEAELDKISQIKLTLETQIMSIEAAVMNSSMLEAIQVGSSAMKRLHKETDVDAVDTVMDDIRERHELNDEINRTLSQPMVDPLLMDDDALLAELREMEEQEQDEIVEALNPPIPYMPLVESAPLEGRRHRPATNKKAAVMTREM